MALNLNDSVVALSHAKALLAQPKLSGAHKFLGRLYMSEALLNLDNISEAVSFTMLSKTEFICYCFKLLSYYLDLRFSRVHATL